MKKNMSWKIMFSFCTLILARANRMYKFKEKNRESFLIRFIIIIANNLPYLISNYNMMLLFDVFGFCDLFMTPTC